MNSAACNRRQTVRSRKKFLRTSSFSFGSLALAHLVSQGTKFSAITDQFDPLTTKPPHFPTKTKSVIFIFLQGDPSQVDTFDPKTTLTRLDGKPLPDSFRGGELGLQFIRASEAKLMGSRRSFQRYGRSGLEISDL